MAKKGISLHIGLNAVDPGHYAGWGGPLNACEADAEDMEAIAKDLGFAHAIFKTKQATRKSVKAAIADAAAKLDSGDIFFLTYSGHGGQVPDVTGDEQDDGEDETWCLYDGEMLDDELYVGWAKFKAGVRILVLSDSCHSGTVTKDMPVLDPARPAARVEAAISVAPSLPGVRAMPTAVAQRTYRANREFYDNLGKEYTERRVPIQATVRLISGCQDNQTSADGDFNGLFTGTLLRVWNHGRYRGRSYRAFHKAIQQKMPREQSPNHFVLGAANPQFDAEKPFTV